MDRDHTARGKQKTLLHSLAQGEGEKNKRGRMEVASEGTVGLSHQLQVSAKLVISPDPLLPPQSICNCATANDTKLIFISKTNERHLKVGRSPECLCFDCRRSLRGDACSQESLGQSCHGAFAATFNSLQPQQSCVDNPHGRSIAKSANG